MKINLNSVNPKSFAISLLLSGILLLASCSTQFKLDDNYKKLLQRTQNDNNFIDTNYISRLAVNYVIRAATYQQQGRIADAVIELQEALKIDKSASIYYALAKNYDLMYKPHLAIENALLALKSDSLFTPAMELLGDLYSNQHRFNDAIVMYEQIYKINPEKSNQLRMAYVYQLTNPQKSISLLEDYLKDNNDAFIMLELVKLYKSTNNTEKLTETIVRLDKIADSQENVHASLLEYYLSLGDFNKALVKLKKIKDIAQSPTLENAFGLYSNYLLDDSTKAGEDDIKAYLTLIDQRFYFDYKFQLIAAYLYDKINNSSQFEFFIKHALELADTLPDVPINVIAYYTNKKNYEKALELAEYYKAKFPNEVRLILSFGYIYYLQNRFDEALKSFIAARVLEPNNIDVLVQIGTTYDRLGLYDSVYAVYDEALRIAPDEPLVNNNYAYTLSEQNVRLDDALKMINTSLIAEPNNSYYLDTYAWIQFRLGNYNICEEYLNLSIKTGHVNAEVYDHLGELYLVKGDKTKALDAWKKGLELEPENKSLKEKIKKLD